MTNENSWFPQRSQSGNSPSRFKSLVSNPKLQPTYQPESNSMIDRRQFVIHVSATGAALFAGQALAQAPLPLLAETDPQAAALGYKADTTKVDAAKYPKHAAAQNCANCALYQGKATDAAGGCPLFAGKQVAAKGWCSAWAKKA